MALVVNDAALPLPADYPMPSVKYDPTTMHFAVRVAYDDEVPSKGSVIYFHGSGTTGPLTGPLFDALVAAGYTLYSVQYFGVGDSSPNPFRYGYGNVNAPHFTSHFIKSGWWVEAAVRALAPSIPTDVVLLGQSFGAAALLTWSAGYTGTKTVLPNIKGILANGATVAGLGDLSWNDVNRNINSLTPIVQQLKDRTLMVYGGQDQYAPPDYVKRLQMAIPLDTETYVLTPGSTYGHTWINESPANAALVVEWVDQLIDGLPILRGGGSSVPAIPGPATPLGNPTAILEYEETSSQVGFRAPYPGFSGYGGLAPRAIGAGREITRCSYEPGSRRFTFSISGSENDGWNALLINGNLFMRADGTVTYTPATDQISWAYNDVDNPFTRDYLQGILYG